MRKTTKGNAGDRLRGMIRLAGPATFFFANRLDTLTISILKVERWLAQVTDNDVLDGPVIWVEF